MAKSSVLGFLGVSVLLGWAYVIFASDLFKLHHVEVRGLVTQDPYQAAREVMDAYDALPHAWLAPSRHKLFFDAHALEQTLVTSNTFADAHVESLDKDILRLLVVESQRRIGVVTPQGSFWMNADGQQIGSMSEPEQLKLQQQRRGSTKDFLYVDWPNALQTSSTMIMDTFTSKAYFELIRILRHEDLPATFIEAQSSSSMARLYLLKQPTMILDVSEPLQAQIDAYRRFMSLVNKKQTPKEYVDVRIPGRVYAK